eukprot:TRINITY_DN67246_c11_g5_i1.p1 TRINITY_DN67246_c11_g5~~TRINITY_DN67246_c11_g5_i1.p1  ORF type:complete len:428 (-),score=44.28 TRINITY_DN67246_c11_g5_i1:1003-2286(-)
MFNTTPAFAPTPQQYDVWVQMLMQNQNMQSHPQPQKRPAPATPPRSVRQRRDEYTGATSTSMLPVTIPTNAPADFVSTQSVGGASSSVTTHVTAQPQQQALGVNQPPAELLPQFHEVRATPNMPIRVMEHTEFDFAPPCRLGAARATPNEPVIEPLSHTAIPTTPTTPPVVAPSSPTTSVVSLPCGSVASVQESVGTIQIPPPLELPSSVRSLSPTRSLSLRPTPVSAISVPIQEFPQADTTYMAGEGGRKMPKGRASLRMCETQSQTLWKKKGHLTGVGIPKIARYCTCDHFCTQQVVCSCDLLCFIKNHIQTATPLLERLDMECPHGFKARAIPRLYNCDELVGKTCEYSEKRHYHCVETDASSGERCTYSCLLPVQMKRHVAKEHYAVWQQHLTQAGMVVNGYQPDQISVADDDHSEINYEEGW